MTALRFSRYKGRPLSGFTESTANRVRDLRIDQRGACQGPSLEHKRQIKAVLEKVIRSVPGELN